MTPKISMSTASHAEAQEQADEQGISLEQYLANWLKYPCEVVDMEGETIAVITKDMVPEQVPVIEQPEEEQ